MNIFAVSDNPDCCAYVLDDRRLVKMTLETAQLLCNAIRQIDPDTPELYKATHKNHPCSLWVQADRKNFSWTIRLFFSYAAEYTRRFGKVHACEQKFGDLFRYHFDEQDLPSSWCNVTPYKDFESVHSAYVVYLNDKWDFDEEAGRSPKWSNRNGHKNSDSSHVSTSSCVLVHEKNHD